MPAFNYTCILQEERASKALDIELTGVWYSSVQVSSLALIDAGIWNWLLKCSSSTS